MTAADFAAFWNRLIESGHRVFGHFPPERLLNVRFEDGQTQPETELARMVRSIAPELHDDAWLREAAAIVEACAPGLARLGYST